MLWCLSFKADVTYASGETSLYLLGLKMQINTKYRCSNFFEGWVLYLIRILREAPPWFKGWIAIIPCLFFSIVFLYFGFRYSKEAHQLLMEDERQPELLRSLPWWVSKLFLIVMGSGLLIFCILYFLNVPEEF
jgi:hypothetical protein